MSDELLQEIELLVMQLNQSRDVVKRHAAELNRRRGEMSVARDALQQLGETEGTFYERVQRLGLYKQAMESMARQVIHPKMTAMEMAEMQLKTNTDDKPAKGRGDQSGEATR